MSTKLVQLTGADTYVSPRTYEIAVTRGQVVKARTVDANRLLAATNNSEEQGLATLFTLVADVPHDIDISGKFVDSGDLPKTPVAISADLLAGREPYIPRGTELVDETGIPYGYSDGAGGYVSVRSEAEAENTRSAQLAKRLSPTPSAVTDKISNDQESASFLQKATFGPTLAEVQALTALGSKRAWLQGEYAKRLTKRYSDRGFIDLGVTDLTTFSSVTQIEAALLTAFQQEPAALRTKLTWVLSKLFIISLPGGAFDDQGLFYPFTSWYDRLDRHVFGNYRDLLESITYSLHMSRMLTYFANQKASEDGTRQPDENYAREIMQLFTIGLYELNIDGTYRLDPSGNKIPTYTLEDIRQVARCLTGLTRWDQNDTFYRTSSPANDTVASTGWQSASGPFVYSDPDARLRHYLPFYEYGAKKALNGRLEVPNGTDPVTNLSLMHDALFNHPNTPVFFAVRMIQHLVTSNPSPEYVTRVAQAFIDNGKGVRGDMKAVWTAILTDEDAAQDGRDVKTFGRIRDSFEMYMSHCRSLDRRNNAGNLIISSDATVGGYQADFGPSNPRYSPSIFGPYDPLHSPVELQEKDFLVPEVQMWTDVLLVRALNAQSNIVIAGEPRDTASATTRISNYAMFNLTDTPANMANRLDILLCGGKMSPSLRASIVALATAMPTGTADQQQERVSVLLQLVLSSTDFMVQL